MTTIPNRHIHNCADTVSGITILCLYIRVLSTVSHPSKIGPKQLLPAPIRC